MLESFLKLSFSSSTEKPADRSLFAIDEYVAGMEVKGEDKDDLKYALKSRSSITTVRYDQSY
jgi:hypothetical protein